MSHFIPRRRTISKRPFGTAYCMSKLVCSLCGVLDCYWVSWCFCVSVHACMCIIFWVYNIVWFCVYLFLHFFSELVFMSVFCFYVGVCVYDHVFYFQKVTSWRLINDNGCLRGHKQTVGRQPVYRYVWSVNVCVFKILNLSLLHAFACAKIYKIL